MKILGAPGDYEVDWWSPEPGDDWGPVERSEFDDVDEPDGVSQRGSPLVHGGRKRIHSVQQPTSDSKVDPPT